MFRFISRRACAVAAVAIIVLAQPARAQTLPKGEEILDKNFEASGGKAAHEKIKSRVTKGTIEVASNNIKGDVVIYSALPGKFRFETELAGIGKIVEGSDGKIAWSLSPITGPRLKDGTEKESALRRADLEGEANWRKHIKKVECTGEDTVEEKPCYKVEVTTDDGQVKTQFYDKSSYLLIKSAGKEKTINGDLDVEAILSDYRKVDGLMLPFKTRQKVISNEVVITLDKIEHNVDIPESTFQTPDEIKKLVEKADK